MPKKNHKGKDKSLFQSLARAKSKINENYNIYGKQMMKIHL